ncbi:restriction endonuclease [Streptomyces sp. P11-1]|uniref:restriction endonuclease n=1 Tax=Streptomyces sp. P11-1 TaxID=3423221 RepID=UPI003D2EE450
MSVQEGLAVTELVESELGDEGEGKLTLAALVARVQRADLPVPVQNPAKLSLDQLDPEVFERLVAEIVSRGDHRGVSFYGRRGQKQYGLDIVERQPDHRRCLCQVKRYSTLTKSLLTKAVEDYAGAPRKPGHDLPPRRFEPYRFVVVTSAETEPDTDLVDAIHALQKSYADRATLSCFQAVIIGSINAYCSSGKLLRCGSLFTPRISAWACPSSGRGGGRCHDQAITNRGKPGLMPTQERVRRQPALALPGRSLHRDIRVDRELVQLAPTPQRPWFPQPCRIRDCRGSLTNTPNVSAKAEQAHLPAPHDEGQRMVVRAGDRTRRPGTGLRRVPAGRSAPRTRTGSTGASIESAQGLRQGSGAAR